MQPKTGTTMHVEHLPASSVRPSAPQFTVWLVLRATENGSDTTSSQLMSTTTYTN